MMYCQKCRSPLRMHESLEILNPVAFDIVTNGSITPKSSGKAPSPACYLHERKTVYDQASKNVQSPVFKRFIPPPRYIQNTSSRAAQDNPAMSFVMLTDSQVVPPKTTGHHGQSNHVDDGRRRQQMSKTLDPEQQSVSQQIESTTRLFQILSSRSDIDHPICVECTELLMEGLQNRLIVTSKERDAYIDFLKALNKDVPTEEEVQKACQELEEAEKLEVDAFEELLRLEQEKRDLDNEFAALEVQSNNLDVAEEKFWRERNEFASTLTSFQGERDAINTKYDYDSKHMEQLQRTNVYNDTFCIGYDGYFGTINGLRLGRLANPTVEWTEINAAWGQALLLLATVAIKLDFKFEGYRLKPMGSMSRIEKIEFPQSGSANGIIGSMSPHDITPTPKVTILELYSSGDLPLGQSWLHRRFNAGTCAFLDCLLQLGEFVERESAKASGTPGLNLPYAIKKDKIGDVSIKLGFNQDENWTRACKYALTCCKFLLAHASNIAGAARRHGTRA